MEDTELLRFLDGELDPSKASKFAERLRREPALRRRAAELRAIETAYQDNEVPSGEQRGAVLGLVRGAPVTTHYDLIRREDLKALSQVQTANAPVFSLYLDLDPQRRELEPPLKRFKNMLRQASQQQPPNQSARQYHERFEEEADRLQTWLEDEQPLQGRGLAILSCLSIGLWRAFRLPVPVVDRLEVSNRPYLRPLVILLDEFESYLVVLIGDQEARLIEVRLGTAEESKDLKSDVPPKAELNPKKPSRRRETHLHRHAKSVAARTEAYWRDHDCNWLVIGGTEKALGELRDQLPKPIREHLAGELHLSPETSTNEILDRVLVIERDHERQVEERRVEELITAGLKGGPAVLGLEATLRAVEENKVRLLIVEEGFAPGGWECPKDHFFGASQMNLCPLCGTALIPVPDIVELALERVLEQNGDIEVLRGPQSRHALAKHGQIGAILASG